MAMDQANNQMVEPNYDESVAAIVAAYRRRKLTEHMIGPALSLIIHTIVLVSLAVFLTAKPQQAVGPVAVEVTMRDAPPTEIEDSAESDDAEEEEETAPLEPTLDIDVTDIADPPELETAETTLDAIAIEPAESVDAFELLDLYSIDNVAVATSDNSTPDRMNGFEAIRDSNPFGGGHNDTGETGGGGDGNAFGGGPLSARSEKGREAARAKHGGNPEGEDAVLRALRWLQSVQQPDGSWGQTGYSGLALLCFLAHGETPASKEFGTTVEKSINWLVAKMPVTGESPSAYQNGIATYALAEAYAMTRDTYPMEHIYDAMDAGLRQIVEGQLAEGGYAYAYGEGTWDLSVAGWQFQALKAGGAAGANVPGMERAVSKGLDFLMHHAYANGNFGYNTKPTKDTEPGGNMTGVGALSLQALGRPLALQARGGINTIIKVRLSDYKWENANSSLYGWYYDTQAIFNDKKKANWNRWNKKMQKVLIDNQHEDGYWKLRENFYGDTEENARHVMSTALCCLQLEVYYRYAPGGGTKRIVRGPRKPPRVLSKNDSLFESDIDTHFERNPDKNKKTEPATDSEHARKEPAGSGLLDDDDADLEALIMQ